MEGWPPALHQDREVTDSVRSSDPAGEEAMAINGTIMCLECYEASDRSVSQGTGVRVRMDHGAHCGGGVEQG